MSVPVDLAELQAQLAEFGNTPYLVTTGRDFRPHTTHVVVTVHDDEIVCDVGRKTAANAEQHGLVALLWAPHTPNGYSLIVDGEVRCAEPGDDQPTRLRISPSKAILHRNARGDSYEADCRRLDGSTP